MAQDILQSVKTIFSKPDSDFFIELNEGSPPGHASSRIFKGDLSITISRDLAKAEISDINLFTLVAFTICHEIAHCLGGHLKVIDKSILDSKSIEAHADYIGARLMSWYFGTLPDNDKINNLEFYKSFRDDPFHQLTDAFLYIKKYTFDMEGMGRYPTNGYRLTLIIGGVYSYLARIGVLNRNILHLMAKTILRSGISSSEAFSAMINSNSNAQVQVNLQQLVDDGLTDKATNLREIKVEYWFLFATHQQIQSIVDQQVLQ
ncbi:hypothetical protein [Idiomarina baltica]|uniref:Uncharacterized protein n=1 Tax=Idiomarina baltica OS145 TaxID=314276 RepID=A0ABP2CPF8_9GAMM|nr:hypothetical protein [Idiomarina baltica]EAQ31558.1 hypothetical protein OS145_09735 [Idiomarina baltica OS145]